MQEVRGRMGLRIKDFALRVGWSVDTQSRLEKGETPFKLHHLERLIATGIIQRGSFLHREFRSRISDDWQLKQRKGLQSNPELVAALLTAVALVVRNGDGETIQRILAVIQERAA